jgi:hypothetical protein
MDTNSPYAVLRHLGLWPLCSRPTGVEPQMSANWARHIFPAGVTQRPV